MEKVRIMARLDIKGPNLIKGIHLEGLRVVGNPEEYAQKYYDMGVDELIYMDAVASLYNRNNLVDIVRKTSENIFIPLTVGGGIRNLDDMKMLLRSGADKLAINTQAIKEPSLITAGARKYGSQCIVLSIEAKSKGKGQWEAYIDNGREHTELDVIEWAKKGERLGAGEILLTSIDQEGTRRGFDVELVKAVANEVSIPVIASGGFGKIEDFLQVVKEGGVSAVAIADAFHYNRIQIDQIRKACLENELNVRQGHR